MSKKKFALLLFCLVGKLSVLSAQPDSVTSLSLNEVVVVASRYERPLSEVHRKITVISSEKIQSAAYLSVADVLTQEAGLFIAGQTQTPGSNQSVFLRGANSNQIIILLDGVRIHDPSSPNGVLDLSELSLTDIERIEVLRGAQGSMYGSSGIGGVINIITKSASQGLKGIISAQGTRLHDGTIIGRSNGAIRYGYDNGFYHALAWDVTQARGMDATVKGEPGFDNFTSDRDNFSKRDFQLKTGLNRSNFKAHMLYKRVDQTAEIDQGAFRDDDNAQLAFSRNLLTYHVDIPLGNGNLIWIGNASDLKRNFTNDSSTIDAQGNTDQSYSSSQNKGRHAVNEVQYVLRRTGLNFIVGSGFSHESMDFDSYFFSNAFGPFELIQQYDTVDLTMFNSYFFSQLLIGWTEKISLTAGHRFNHNNRYGNQQSFDISSAYKSKRFDFNVTYATGYQNPSLIQLFDPSETFGSPIRRGNPDLIPELSAGIELGLVIKPTAAFNFNLSVYRNQVSNVIEYVYLWRNTNSIENLGFSDYAGDTYINLSRLNSQGIETGIEYKLAKASFKANYQYLSGDFRFDANDLPPEIKENYHVQSFNIGSFLGTEEVKGKLTRRPGHLINASAGYQFLPELKASLHYRMVSARNDVFYDANLGPFGALNTLNLDPFHLINLNATYKHKSGLTLLAQCDNLFNNQYQEIRGFAARGRGFSFGLSYQF